MEGGRRWGRGKDPGGGDGFGGVKGDRSREVLGKWEIIRITNRTFLRPPYDFTIS